MHGPPNTFQVMVKPAGAACNLDCQYCFYRDKAPDKMGGAPARMSDDVLEAFVRQHIQAHRGSDLEFTWQGGEPTLLGLEFFEKAVACQRRYAEGRPIHNAIQTNGILLDNAWCDFLKREQFLVGLSLDGPQPLHDRYRRDADGQSAFARVMQGLEALKSHEIEFNTLTVVHRESAKQPLDVYRFLKEIGSNFLQFIPLVERRPDDAGPSRGSRIAPPPKPDGSDGPDLAVTESSVRAGDYGEFLVTLFDEWVRQDVGHVFVQLFDVALGIWMGYPAGLCLFSEQCGNAVVLEVDGEVYACDHFVFPEYRLGNLLETDFGDLVRSPRQRQFGDAKAQTLPAYCRQCDVRFACQGECPKNRFQRTPDGEPGLNYLCAAYKRFFHHVDPAMRGMAYLARHHRAPAEIMRLGVPPVKVARAAAIELITLWMAEKRAHGEPVPGETDSMFATLEVPDHALQSA